MKGTFFQSPESAMENDAQSWFDPNNQLTSSTFVTQEKVPFVMKWLPIESSNRNDPTTVPSKTASYITHRQFRVGRRDVLNLSFEVYSRARQKKFYPKMGDLTAVPIRM
jgi:hypothetical protein